MCTECKDKKLSFHDYCEQQAEFKKKEIISYERIYTCNSCGMKYYIDETKNSKLVRMIYVLLKCGMMVLIYFLSFFLLKDIVKDENISIYIRVIIGIIFVSIFTALDMFINSKYKYFIWLTSSVKLIPKEQFS